MDVNFINVLETKEEFLERIYKKGKSYEAKEQARSAINNLNYYCLEVFKKSEVEILKDLNRQNVEKVVQILKGFVVWCGKDHPDIHLDKKRTLKRKRASTIRPYLTQIRKYMKFCYGLRINDDDFRDYVLDIIEPDDDDEEAEPLTHEDLRTIIDNARDPRRKVMYLVAKDTAGRLKELLQLKKENFNLSKNPPVVTFPKSITKKRAGKRECRLTPETTPQLKNLLNPLNDSDYVFSTNPTSIKSAKANEHASWVTLIKKLGKTDPKWSERYEKNDRYKKNFHSIRAFCMTQIKQATKDKDFADAYAGHARYLPQYIRLEEKEKVELFEKCIPFLSIYEKYQVVDHAEELNLVRQKLETIENYVYSTTQPRLKELAENPSMFWSKYGK